MKTATDIKAEIEDLERTRLRTVDGLADTRATAARLEAKRPALAARAQLDGDEAAAAELAQVDRELADAARAEANLTALLDGTAERHAQRLEELRLQALAELDAILARLAKQRDDIARQACETRQDAAVDRLIALERQHYSFSLAVYNVTGDQRYWRHWVPERLLGGDSIAEALYRAHRRRHPAAAGPPQLYPGDRCNELGPLLELLAFATPKAAERVVNLT